MSDYSYKCKSARAVATKIWNADFYQGSFNELVESNDPDVVIASVGLSEISGPGQRLSMVATLNNHPWCAEIAEVLIHDILSSDPPLLEWSVDYKNLSWTITMVWRN